MSPILPPVGGGGVQEGSPPRLILDLQVIEGAGKHHCLCGKPIFTPDRLKECPKFLKIFPRNLRIFSNGICGSVFLETSRSKVIVRIPRLRLLSCPRSATEFHIGAAMVLTKLRRSGESCGP